MLSEFRRCKGQSQGGKIATWKGEAALEEELSPKY